MIVITGGAGFIGSCLLAHLNSLGREDVLIVDHWEGEGDLKKHNLKNKKFVRFFDKKDFLDLILKDQIHTQLESRIEMLIHMGACSSTTLQDSQYFKENNYEYSCHLAQWALHHDCRFIYASSAATYGDGRQGYQDDMETLKRLQPLNLYGESKHKFDLWILKQGFIDKVVGLKFFNVFGPNEYHKGEMRSVILKAYGQVMEKGEMGLFKSYRKKYKDGEQKRDFIYIKDAINIVDFFLKNPQIKGIFNVGTGIARSWNDLAMALFQAVGKIPCIDYVEMPMTLRSRYQYFTQAEIRKLQGCGYIKPFTSLEEAVKDYTLYLKNDNYI